MISEGYLQECPVQNGFGSTVDLTMEGHAWLQKSARSDDCTMLVTTNHELLALDRDRSRPELTFSARFVRRISCVNDDYFISLRYLCFDLDILFFGMVSIDAIWNWLPDSMRDPAISRDSFRHSLKTFLFSAYLCT